MAKAIIVYYSYSGNTEKVAAILKEELSKNYNCDILKIETINESASFLKQCYNAFNKKKAAIKEGLLTDLTDYELVVFGTPVWAFRMAPGLRTYLDKCTDLEGKKAVCFATYGSGAGKNKCIREICKIAKNKGATSAKGFLIQMGKGRKKELILQEAREALL